MKRGTYSEFLSSGVDIFSLFEKGNDQYEPSPVLEAPTLISNSSVQSQQSPRPSLKYAAPEDHDVSFSSCNTLWCVCSWWPYGPSVSSACIFICPKVYPKVPKVLFHGIGRVRRAGREKACLEFCFGCRTENLMETRSGCTAMTSWVYVAHTDMRTHHFIIVMSYLLWWSLASLMNPEA